MADKEPGNRNLRDHNRRRFRAGSRRPTDRRETGAGKRARSERGQLADEAQEADTDEESLAATRIALKAREPELNAADERLAEFTGVEEERARLAREQTALRNDFERYQGSTCGSGRP